jgi:hypothetical protein
VAVSSRRVWAAVLLVKEHTYLSLTTLLKTAKTLSLRIIERLIGIGIPPLLIPAWLLAEVFWLSSHAGMTTISLVVS